MSETFLPPLFNSWLLLCLGIWRDVEKNTNPNDLVVTAETSQRHQTSHTDGLFIDRLIHSEAVSIVYVWQTEAEHWATGTTRTGDTEQFIIHGILA